MPAAQKKPPPPEILLAQEAEIQQLMTQFQATESTGIAVQQLEGLLRTAIFKPTVALGGQMLQAAADRFDHLCFLF